MDRLTQAGITAIERARSAWLQGIVEPRKAGENMLSAQWIDSIIRTEAGLDWGWLPRHEIFDNYEWCGAFAAHCWTSVDLDIRRMYFSSTARLDAWARYAPMFGSSSEKKLMARFPKPAEADMQRQRLVLTEDSTPAQVTAFAPREGDILIVGATGSKMGTHIAIIERWDAARGVFLTIEGNARGRLGASGFEGRQGVVRQERKVGLAPGEPRKNYHARRIIRPSVLDLAVTK
jgi:hypothetical protein